MLAEDLSGALAGISPGVYSARDFEAISAIVYRGAGIVLPPSKAMLVYSRLAPMVRDTNCGTFANYVEKIEHDAAERTRAIEALTTNHTFFYREAHHFEHFAAEVRPELLQRITPMPVAGCVPCASMPDSAAAIWAASPKPLMLTRQPAAARASAMAKPMPEVPPVTNAVRPARKMSFMEPPYGDCLPITIRRMPAAFSCTKVP